MNAIHRLPVSARAAGLAAAAVLILIVALAAANARGGLARPALFTGGLSPNQSAAVQGGKILFTDLPPGETFFPMVLRNR